jgi:GABA(A) receptor-associated protein
MSFKSKYTFKQRIQESTRVLSKYPNRVPIICEKSSNTHGPNIEKKKYLVIDDLIISQFILVIRQRLRISEETAIFLIVGDGIIPANTSTMGVLYDVYKDMDGYLYITYSFENIFG